MSTFSIITVTRHNLKGLKQTGESVAAQSCRDFEWIVIDGASADGSVQWLETSKAKWISEPDNGIYDAMNKGIEMAQGDFLIFMNAGDVFAANEILERIKDRLFAKAEMPGFVYGDSLEAADGLAVAKPARECAKIKLGMPTHHQAMFYQRNAVGDLRYDTNYRIAADYKFTAQLLQKTGDTLYLGFPVCVFDSGGVSQQRVLQGRNEMFKIRHELKLCNLTENAKLYVLQTLLMALRRLSPRIYWRLRQSCGNSANDRAPAQNLPDRQESQA